MTSSRRSGPTCSAVSPTVTPSRDSQQHGRNELAAEKPPPAWRRFLAQFQDVLVILLLVATAISAGLWAYERDAALPYEAIAIFAVVLLNATMGYVQESRAEAAVAALRAMSAATPRSFATASDAASPPRISFPATSSSSKKATPFRPMARLIESASLQTAEAALTGESLPVTKDTAPIADDVPLGDRHNMVFSGTAATYGHGTAIVTATGMRTEMGRIAGLLKETHDEATPLQRELDRTGKVLGIVVVVIAVVMIATIIIVEDVRGAVGDLRRADSRRRARRGGGAGRPAGHRDRGSRDRRAAHGPA